SFSSSSLMEKTKPAFSFLNKNKADSDSDGWVTAEFKQIESGVRVNHGRFGEGTVLRTEVVAGDKRAIVDFGPLGEKTLILKFAKLKIKKD
ncbi:MAG: ATP-dependent DNA helicase, partial [Bacteroidales bacterium]|nr:ATP-dependent DNA helicase [Bacteroidales bacterium]